MIVQCDWCFDNFILYKLDRKINAQTNDGDLHNPNLNICQSCATDSHATFCTVSDIDLK